MSSSQVLVKIDSGALVSTLVNKVEDKLLDLKDKSQFLTRD